jgi:hypothetical protein
MAVVVAVVHVSIAPRAAFMANALMTVHQTVWVRFVATMVVVEPVDRVGGTIPASRANVLPMRAACPIVMARNVGMMAVVAIVGLVQRVGCARLGRASIHVSLNVRASNVAAMAVAEPAVNVRKDSAVIWLANVNRVRHFVAHESVAMMAVAVAAERVAKGSFATLA